MDNEGMYLPSGFLGMLRPRGSTHNSDSCYSDFLAMARAEPDISVCTRSYVVHLMHSDAAHVAVDPEKQITLMLHGEIYNASGKQAEFLLEQYTRHGISFSKDINGSFAVLLIDRREDMVALVTDRLNSRKVFHSVCEGNHWLSTSLNLHPTSDAGIDHVGVAHYLASGAVYNNRTLFDGVRVLERASIHSFTENGLDLERYWSYTFTDSYSGIPEEKLRDELSDLLVESVRSRLRDDPKVFLSLSGGNDSRAILGILALKLGVSDIECISYGLGKPKPHSDEQVAEQIANYLGLNHRLLHSCNSDLSNVIASAATFGRGMLTDAACESDAYMEMAGDFSETPSVLFVADECFGYYDWKAKSNIDALKCVRVCDFHVLSWLSDLLPETIYNALCEGLNEDIQHMAGRCPSTTQYRSSMDFLYLDQRLPNVLLSWREFLTGQFVSVRNPFLDNSILDFMAQVPGVLRRGKALYMKAITTMLPDLYRFKTAHSSSYYPDWRNGLIDQFDAIEERILSEDSRLDHTIPPDLILGLLQNNRNNSRPTLRLLVTNAAKRLLKETAMDEGFMDRVVSSYYYRLPAKKVDIPTFIRRALIIRSAVAE